MGRGTRWGTHHDIQWDTTGEESRPSRPIGIVGFRMDTEVSGNKDGVSVKDKG